MLQQAMPDVVLRDQRLRDDKIIQSSRRDGGKRSSLHIVLVARRKRAHVDSKMVQRFPIPVQVGVVFYRWRDKKSFSSPPMEVLENRIGGQQLKFS